MQVGFRARPVRIEAHPLEAPIERPVVTSFGIMRARPALLVRLVDADGCAGWGEAWCNFPPGGARQRAAVIEAMVSPWLGETDAGGPVALYDALTRRFRVIGLQTGEPGLFAQVAAAVDLAAWDLAARQRGEPLWRCLGGAAEAGSDGAGGGDACSGDANPRGANPGGVRSGGANPGGVGSDGVGSDGVGSDGANLSETSVPCYASGINPGEVEARIGEARAAGYRAFKVKIGFGRARDLATLAAARAAAGGLALMADVNQGWSVAEALAHLPELAAFDLGFLEEPVPSDTPLTDWRALAEAAPMPLAAGENLRGSGFEAAAASGAFAVLQPDVAKWGGFSGTLPAIRRFRAKGPAFWPHFLGAAVGLVASAHLLRAAGGPGMLEVDVNPNPLRTDLGATVAPGPDGGFALPRGPGLGFEPDPAVLRAFRAA